MLVVNDDNTISITRGDTLRVLIVPTYEDGTEYVPEEGDKFRFAVKRNRKAKTVILEKEIPNSTMELHLTSEETKMFLEGKSYFYDIQVTKANGDVDTFISSDITFGYEVN